MRWQEDKRDGTPPNGSVPRLSSNVEDDRLALMQEMLKSLQSLEQASKAKDPGLNSICVANGAIAVFFASLGVSVLSYVQAAFSDRLARSSDTAINSLLWISVVCAGVTAFGFTIGQIVTVQGGRGPVQEMVDAVAQWTSFAPLIAIAGCGLAVFMSTMFFFVSMCALFAGILMFLWVDQHHAIALSVTLVFAAAWGSSLLWMIPFLLRLCDMGDAD